MASAIIDFNANAEYCKRQMKHQFKTKLHCQAIKTNDTIEYFDQIYKPSKMSWFHLIFSSCQKKSGYSFTQA